MSNSALAAQSGPHSVTLQHIATRCGVHKTTVYRALIGSRRVGPATTERIRAVAKEMGYDHSMNLSARQLSARKTGRTVLNHLAVLFFPPGFLDDYYFSLLFRGIQAELHAQHFDLITTFLDATSEGGLPLSMMRGDVDGILMLCRPEWGRALVEKVARETKLAPCPTVSLMSRLDGCFSVVADEYEGARLSLAHLLELGHRRVLFVTAPDIPKYHLNQRLEGYRAACQEAGLAFEDIVEVRTHRPAPEMRPDLQMVVHYYDDHGNLIRIDKPDSPPDFIADLRDIVTRCFDGTHGFSAVLTRNDSYAIIMRKLLSQQGLRVPQDVSIIGFDDTRPLAFHDLEMNTDLHHEFLTTVRLPLEAIGKAAARLMVSAIASQDFDDTHQTLPVELIVRDTTAPPAIDLTFAHRSKT